MNKNVLLLGANGQLGLLVANAAPTTITLFPYGSRQLDITNSAAITNVLEEVSPALIINAAAYTQVDKAEEDEGQAYAVNKTGPELIASLSSKSTKIIHISTDFVFDGNNKSPYKATDSTNPVSVYGRSKLAGERALLELAPERTTIIRTAWLYSADGKNFVNTMLHLMATREELSIVADQKGTPTSAAGLAEVIWMFADGNVAPGIYHWTDREEELQEEHVTSWYGFACAIQAEAISLGLLDKAIPLKPISTADYPTPAARPAYSVLDKSKTYAALEFNGRPWRNELREVLQAKLN